MCQFNSCQCVFFLSLPLTHAHSYIHHRAHARTRTSQELIPYEQVVKELDADSVDLEAGLGMSGCRFSTGSVPQAAFICMKVQQVKLRRCS